MSTADTILITINRSFNQSFDKRPTHKSLKFENSIKDKMLRELPPDLAKVAKKELNEDPKHLKNDIENLKTWISKQSHLKARTDDQWLVAILRGCKFSLEKVKKKLDLYYTLKTTAPDVTLRLNPTKPQFVEFLRLGTCLILPKANNILTPRTILLRPGAYNPDTNSIADVMCLLYYLVQILVMEDDSATVMGTKIVVDYQDVTINHITQANPALLKKMLAVSQESMPLRLKGNHHLNMSPVVETIFSIIRGLLNEKAKDRMKIHKSHSELLDHIPKESIPAEYGGSGGSIANINEYWVRKVSEYRSWMQTETSLGTDESRRIGKPQTSEDMFGIQGSFRQLDID